MAVLNSTKTPSGRVKVGDTVRHRNHPKVSTIVSIIRTKHGTSILLEDGRDIDPLYTVPTKGKGASENGSRS